MNLIFLLMVTVGMGWAKDIVIGVPIQVRNIDPIDLKYLEEWEVYAGIHNTLIQYDARAAYRSRLAKKWDYNPKTGLITFEIFPDLKFSDGSPLDAESVAFSLRRILFLDSKRQMSLTRCLNVNQTILSPFEPVAGIQVLSKVKVVIGPTQCGESLLNDLANANYGIISPKALSSNYRLKAEHKPVSGIFVPDFRNDKRIVLKSNPYSQHYDPRREALKLVIKKVDDLGPDVDVYRTSRQSELEKARKRGYFVQTSLPIMSWFLAADANSKVELAANVVADINYRLDREQLAYFKDNTLETASKTFFPKDFNCVQTPGKVPPKFVKPDIRLVSHPSSEDRGFVTQLKSAIESLGYKVVIDDSYQNSGGHVSDPAVTLLVTRQFLGDDIANIFGHIFNVFKTIPDHHKIMVPLIAELEKKSKVRADPIVRRLCQRFSGYFHIPLAIRKYAFISRSDDLKDVFSRATGNLLFEQFALSKARKEHEGH